MGQLINRTIMPYYATIILFILGGALLGSIIVMFVFQKGDVKEDKKVIIILLVAGVILMTLGSYCKNIYSKYHNPVESTVKDMIAKEYPDATDFRFRLDTGYFTVDNTKYKIEYQRTVNGKEQLVITVNSGINDTQSEDNKDKIVKRLDVSNN